MPKHTRMWWVTSSYFYISLILTIVVGVGSLLPPSELPEEIKFFSDKFSHFISYLALHSVWSITYSKAGVGMSFFIAFLLLVYGALIELLQGLYIPGRMADIFDFFANAIGIAVSLIVFLVWRRIIHKT